MAWDWDKLQKKHSRGGSGGSQGQPPGFDEIIEKIRTAKGKFPGGVFLIVIAFIVILLAYSCVYTIALNEVGVIQRFGKFVRIEQPGLNFKLPNGIEKITKVKVDYTYKEEFGLRTLQAGGIKDPYKFLFKVRDVRSTLRDLSEGVMRLVVGDRSINEVIGSRKEVALEAKALLQKELDEAETGIKIVNIEMKKTNVPEAVQPSFNEVNQSIQEKEKVIYQAKEAYNKVIPAAKGNAEKTIKTAEGYALDRVNRAEGDAARFLDVYEEYAKAKDVTRRRLYLESVQVFFPKLGAKYIVDDDQKNLLPFLNLGNSKGGKQ